MPAPSLQFSALADDTRCRIVERLHAGPLPVHKLAETFDISRPAISRHLRLLKEAELIAESRQGRENVYALRRQNLRATSAWLERHWGGKGSKLKQMADEPAEPQMELDL